MISVIVPVYNEQEVILKTLDNVHSTLRNNNLKYELLVVDDGSTDKTKEILRDYADIILISRTINKGYGYSLKEGINKAKSEWILIIDADSSYRVEDILTLITNYSIYDMVVGERTGKKVDIGIFNKLGKMILRILIFLLSSMWIKDINSGLRLFKKELALKYWNLIPDGFSLTTTLTVAAMIEQYEVKFIPINYYKRLGKSKIKPIQDFFNFIVLVFRIISFFRPLRFYLPISVFFLIASVLRAFRDIILFNSIETAAVLLFMISIQAFFFGLLADLIVNKSKD